MKQTILITILLAASAAAGYLAYAHWLADSPADSAGALTTGDDSIPSQSFRPAFALPDVEGVQRSVDEWDGQALVINFWATWCAPCRREIPMLIDLQKEYDGRNVQVIGIAVDFMEDVQRYAAETPFNYPVLVGEQEAIDVAQQFGVDFVGLPFTVFTAPDGRVVDVHTGELLHEDAVASLQKALN